VFINSASGPSEKVVRIHGNLYKFPKHKVRFAYHAEFKKIFIFVREHTMRHKQNASLKA